MGFKTIDWKKAMQDRLDAMTPEERELHFKVKEITANNIFLEKKVESVRYQKYRKPEDPISVKEPATFQLYKKVFVEGGKILVSNRTLFGWGSPWEYGYTEEFCMTTRATIEDKWKYERGFCVDAGNEIYIPWDIVDDLLTESEKLLSPDIGPRKGQNDFYDYTTVWGGENGK